MKLLEYEELQRMVDYSFGDHSGVLGRCPNAYMKKANINNVEFIDKLKKHKSDIMTLFIDNIRLYKRQIDYCDWEKLKPVSQNDRNWFYLDKNNKISTSDECISDLINYKNIH